MKKSTKKEQPAAAAHGFEKAQSSPVASLLIRGGRVVDPAQKLDGELDVLLRDGRVAQVAPPGTLKDAAEIVDAKGLVVAPGLIDLHVHLREPGKAYKETIKSGTAAAAAGGFTSVCAMPNTTPVNDSPAITRWMQDPERGAVVNVFPIAAATVASAGERISNYGALHAAGAVAVSDDGLPILDDKVMAGALETAALVGMPVIQHAEDTRLTQGTQMNLGATSFRLGLRGQPAEAEWRMVERDIRLAHGTRGRLHVAHISTARALELVKLGRQTGVAVSAEVTPHHFLFTEEECAGYDSRYKMNPPLRTAADREALLAGLADGSVDAIATDHAPHALFEKEVEFDKAAWGITGLEIALGAALTVLYHERKVPLARIVALLSSNPARIVGFDGRGTLAVGAHADVTLFDLKANWTYDVRKTRSKARNCPYDGMRFKGRPVMTIVGGRVVFRA